MFKDLIGKRSRKVKNTVERGLVKRFAEAVGDLHPIFVDEEYGRNSRYGQNITPPTFPRVLEYGEVEGMYFPNIGLIHGEQIFHYKRPLLVGEEVYCSTELKDYYEKSGNNGLMAFVVLKRYGEEPSGELIFTEEQIIIITEVVRKELKL